MCSWLWLVFSLCTERAWGKPNSTDLTLTVKDNTCLVLSVCQSFVGDSGVGHRAASLETSGRWETEAQHEMKSRGW